MMQHPTFVRLEYWDPNVPGWVVGHAGTNLMNPAAYIQKLAARGTIARAVDKETGETVYSEGGELL